MCGRYVRAQPLDLSIDAMGVDVEPDLLAQLHADDEPRWNIAPSQRGFIAALDVNGDVGIAKHRWFFMTPRGPRINMRSESAHRVPDYAPLFDRQRCVVFASGFYEPEGDKATEKNRPWWYFKPRDDRPLFFGGVVKEDGFTILTRAPVKPVAGIHDRSPVFIPADNVVAWLDPDIRGQDALARFAPAGYGECLECWRVSDDAKKPKNEGPSLIEPLQQSAGLF